MAKWKYPWSSGITSSTSVGSVFTEPRQCGVNSPKAVCLDMSLADYFSVMPVLHIENWASNLQIGGVLNSEMVL
jgi:hypothetical protein